MSFHTKYRGMMHPPGAAGIVSPGLLFIAPFFFGGIYMVHADAGQRGLPLPPVWLFPIVMLSIGALKLLVHELGHCAAAIVGRFQIQKFSWGTLGWTRLADGWHFSRMPELGYLRGFVGIAPFSGENLRPRLMFFYAGGALTEFLTGCFALLLSLSGLLTDTPQLHVYTGYWALATLLAPFFARTTDGPPIKELWAGGKESDNLCRDYLALMPLATEVRPADWHDSGPLGPFALYYTHIDRFEWEAAEPSLNLVIHQQFWSRRNRIICLEAAYFSARHGNSPVEARGWLTKSGTGDPVERFVELRAEAAVLLAEGNARQSAECARAAIQMAENCPQTGWTQMNASLLRDLYKRANAAVEQEPAHAIS